MSLYHGTDARSAASIAGRGLAPSSYLTSDLAAARRYAARRAAAVGTSHGVVLAVDESAAAAEHFTDFGDLGLPVWRTQRVCRCKAIEQVSAMRRTELGPQDELEGAAGRRMRDEGASFGDPAHRERLNELRQRLSMR